jgi:anthranilate phosphoribosyltransferase
MKHAMPVRRALAVRTIFNVLGPLTNPAGARRQLMGVFDPKLTDTIVRVLGALGAIRAMVVAADDGLDEISTTAPTRLAELRDGQVNTRTVKPEDFGIRRVTLADLAVASAQDSAEVIRAVLAGKQGPARDIVTLNAAAALAVADKAPDIGSAIPLAQQAIDTGRAAAALEKLVVLSNS